MIELSNYTLCVDKRKSSKGNEYCALFLCVGDKMHFICYVKEDFYNYIDNKA